MLSLEAAGALLLVCLGVAVLVVFCCAALIVARTKVAPHADCRRFNEAIALEVADIAEKLKHRNKVAGGRASRAKQDTPPPEEEEPPGPRPGLSEFQRIVVANASRSRVGG